MGRMQQADAAMGLSEEDLARIGSLLAAGTAGAQAVGELRRSFPGLSLTRCDPTDMGDEAPFRSYGRFSLYLVDGRDHCWRLTAEPAQATGLVVVETGGNR